MKFLRGPNTRRTTKTPEQGQPICTTDTKQFYIGDGSTPGGIWTGGAHDHSTSEFGIIATNSHDHTDLIGTTNQTFQINSSTGPKLKNNAGVLEIRNAADTGYSDITVNNLIVKGTTTSINSTVVDIGDNIINLNSGYVGSAPTANGGFTINRGSITASTIIWDESSDLWKAGLSGSEKTLVREGNNITVTGDITGTATFDSAGNLNIATTSVTSGPSFVSNVQSTVGAMFTGNTQSGLTITYDNVAKKVNFNVLDPIITLTGEVTGSATMTNLGNTSIVTSIDDGVF